MTTSEILKITKKASACLLSLDNEAKNRMLCYMAESLLLYEDDILRANADDVANAKGKISEVMLDRLKLDQARVRTMYDGIIDVAKLPDPIGKVISSADRPNGMTISKISVPIGVVGIIYESRPNVTSDAAALALKSSNACVLRSGKEAFCTSFEIVKALKKGIEKAGINSDILNIVEDTGRESANEMMKANGFIDLLIPRGGAGLIRACVENATVPCIQTGTGICHVYVDKNADVQKALKIVENAKVSRPSVCNAQEVLLVHKDIAQEFLPAIKKLICDQRIADGKIPVELRLDDRASRIIDGKRAGDNDFDTEFLDYILAVKVVDSTEEAVNHIGEHSTGHSECIITESKKEAEIFTTYVDSAAVYVNVSTRFTDGGEFGLGCEMGISTQKLHARGPMGLEELTAYKYVITGDGQIR